MKAHKNSAKPFACGSHGRPARRAAGLFCLLMPVAAAEQASLPLLQLVNDYRVEHGLASVPISRSLNAVAAAHVRDLEEHPPTGQCNLHSWSAAGPWTPCCYTSDHQQALCMWDKPREITRGAYSGDGFEISAWSGDPISPEQALEIWKSSPAHKDMLLNRGLWTDAAWQAMGGAVYGHYAVVWFGKEAEAAAPR